MSALDDVAALREQLWTAGFRPLAVLNWNHADKQMAGKAPIGKEWQKRARQDPPEVVRLGAVAHAMNTGVLCDGLRAVDIDIDDPDLAGRVKAHALAMLGEAPIRSRENSSRCLLLYRAATGAPKKLSIAGDLGKVEVLGEGQQFVAFGRHPTGALLTWDRPPGVIQCHDLTALTEQQVLDWLYCIAQTIRADAPRTVSERHPGSGDGKAADTLRLIAALSAIPNHGPADWDQWNKIGMAVWRATDGSAAGWEAWNAWSARHPAYDAEATAQRWEHYRRSPPTEIGAGTIFHLGRQHAGSKPRPDWLWAIFADAHIGHRTIERLNIVAEGNDIACPYRVEGLDRAVVTIDADGKRIWSSKAEPSLFNADAIEAGAPLLWCADELDVAALTECCFDHAVCLPPVRRFAALRAHPEALASVERHVLVLPAGHQDAEELTRRLGRHTVWIVQLEASVWDTLSRDDGYQTIHDAIAAARPCPLDGIREIEDDTLQTIRNTAPPPTMTVGTPGADARIRLPTEGRLIVVTGYPNDGKTAFTRFVMMNTLQRHNRRWLVFTAEEDFDRFLIDCSQVILNKSWKDAEGDDIKHATEALRGRLRLLEVDAERHPPTVDSLLERAAYSVLAHGTTDFLVDPWNEIEHQRGTLNETDYIGRTLQRFRIFGRRYGCNVWIVAHPAKPLPLRAGEKRRPPTLYDISGSSNWANKCDLGLTVFSAGPGQARIIVDKSRHGHRWATRSTRVDLEFDQATSRYLDPLKPPSEDDSEAEPSWHSYD